MLETKLGFYIIERYLMKFINEINFNIFDECILLYKAKISIMNPSN